MKQQDSTGRAKRRTKRAEKPKAATTRTVELSLSDCALLRDALDSHAYWQLSDEHYRNDGFVDEPGSDDPKVAARIVEANRLHDLFEKIAGSS